MAATAARTPPTIAPAFTPPEDVAPDKPDESLVPFDPVDPPPVSLLLLLDPGGYAAPGVPVTGEPSEPLLISSTGGPFKATH